MKSLKESLKRIDEESNVKIIYWNHHNPDQIFYKTTNPDECHALMDNDYNVVYMDENEKPGLILAKWNDESGTFKFLGVRNESSLKKAFENAYTKAINDLGLSFRQVITEDEYYDLCDTDIVVGEAWIHGNIGCQEIRGEKTGEYFILGPKDAYKQFVDFCNRSKVDGDSASAWAVIKMPEFKLVFGPKNSIS